MKYKKNKNELTIIVNDISLKTPFKNDLIAEIISDIYSLINMDYDRTAVFNYFKQSDGSYGFIVKKRKELK
jgi:hypothetical protein